MIAICEMSDFAGTVLLYQVSLRIRPTPSKKQKKEQHKLLFVVSIKVSLLDVAQNIITALFRIAEQHLRILFKEQWVLNTCIASIH